METNLLLYRILKKVMPKSLKSYFKILLKMEDYIEQRWLFDRLTLGVQKGILGSSLRSVNPKNPRSWEISAFSQNGEDGILDFLLEHLKSPNRYFVEFGSGQVIENNSTFLALVKQYRGLQVDAKSGFALLGKGLLGELCVGRVKFIEELITLESIPTILSHSLEKNPDIFSVDIDGNDYHIVKKIFELGIRPKIFVVEYNSGFGAEEAVTVPYQCESFYETGRFREGNYGCSFEGWKKLFQAQGYALAAVEKQGINMFFVDPKQFETDFLLGIEGLQYQSSPYFLHEPFKCLASEFYKNRRPKFDLISI